MRCHNHGSSIVKIIQMVHYLRFIGCIKGIGCLIEKDILRILINGTSYK
ncbi:Uncharacterised protein [Segatella copri]|nr:Uncharacterised protein [Segatella copri]